MSTDAYIGYSGYGILSITEGDMVGNSSGHIGYLPGSYGEVFVSGPFSTWMNGFDLSVGEGGQGYLQIDNGGAVSCLIGSIGGGIFGGGGGSGQVLVAGPDSTFTANGILFLGDFGGYGPGHGELYIVDDGQVIVGVDAYVGYGSLIDFDDGILTTGNLRCATADLIGTGTINTHGLASDVDLVFDDTHGLSQTIGITGLDKDITVYLDVDGSAPITLGYGGNATMSISDGIVVESTSSGYVGYEYGSTGEATVDGDGSTWSNGGNLYIGQSGYGTLNITDGGKVIVGGDTQVHSSGSIIFDNGTLTTGGLLCASANLLGTGTINTHGLVSDVDLVFDDTHGLSQTLSITGSGKNITVILNVDGSAPMGAGYGGSGTMSISDGIVVESTSGYVGYESGSTGEVTVDGTGSAWSNGGSLHVGRSGDGTLNITDGGAVSNDYGYIGYYSSSTSEVTVDGDGSTWSNSDLYVGRSGDGILNITDGGLVTVAGTLTIDKYNNGNSFINIADWGMLALYGQADGSLDDFLDMIEGTPAIRYWDGSDWAILTGESNINYTLTCPSQGPMMGYTVLAIPEPSTLVGLIGLGLAALFALARRRH